MSGNPLAVLEIGTSRIRVVVAEPREDGHLMITGLGEKASMGVRKSDIVDVDTVVACAKPVIHTAEQRAQVIINQVLLVFSGAQVQATVNRGMVPVMASDKVISDDDVEDVMDTARTVSLHEDREVLHSICQNFFVDDQNGVVNPTGMVGSRLALDMLIVHGLRNRLSTLVRVAQECQLTVADAAFGGLCAALAVLTPQQKEGGAILIDLGAGTTDYAVYAGKVIAKAGSVPVGGDHVTNDIAIGLNLSTKQAEPLKTKSAKSLVDLSVRNRVAKVAPDGGYGAREVRLRDLNTIVHARMEELFQLVKEDLTDELSKYQFSSGVILTGGGAYMDGAVELASTVFDMPAHVGRPKGVSGLVDVSDKPDYAAVVGMLKYGLRNADRPAGGFSLGAMFKSLFGRHV